MMPNKVQQHKPIGNSSSDAVTAAALSASPADTVPVVRGFHYKYTKCGDQLMKPAAILKLNVTGDCKKMNVKKTHFNIFHLWI